MTILLCEGTDGSPDIRLIAAILRGPVVGVLRPSGGKEGFRNLVSNLRAGDATKSVCGLADGDFPRRPESWVAPPLCREWRLSVNGVETMLGWMWRRKEIENFFVDPDVVARAHRWDAPTKVAYASALERVFDDLACVTAARMALTAHAPSRNRVDTSMRIDAGEAEIERALRRRAAEYNAHANIDEDALMASYRACLVECRSGGKFRASAVEVFAGKDILAKIQQTAGFSREVKARDALVERILLALAGDLAPHTWLPEWSALRDAVGAWSPTTAPE